MCEFEVILNGEVVSRDVVYAKAEEGKVIVKNVLGESLKYENCGIEEVDVNTTRLVLSAIG